MGATEPFAFVATADMGVNPTAAANVARMVAENPAFALHAGDLAYAASDASTWDAFMQQIKPLTDRAPYYPAAGNHEYDGSLSMYLDRFQLPGNERWYSFNASGVHVVVLDGGSTYGAIPPGETPWLQADLEANANDTSHAWTVVVFHFPLFSAGTTHGSWTGGRSTWGTLFDRYGVDLVINGHDHDYQRSWPVWSNGTVAQRNYSGARAPVYVVTGGGGNGLYALGPKPDWSAFQAVEYETLRVTLNATVMDIKAVRPDGSTLDGFALTKAGVVLPPPPPTVPPAFTTALWIPLVAVAAILVTFGAVLLFRWRTDPEDRGPR